MDQTGKIPVNSPTDQDRNSFKRNKPIREANKRSRHDAMTRLRTLVLASLAVEIAAPTKEFDSSDGHTFTKSPTAKRIVIAPKPPAATPDTASRMAR